ncbi:hypothetical protein BC835DRAFT_994114 [Cytidiella melzeri]|nr:hypothetical protein BC835DRAFT_994114 [Cytidiella melzeri]
MVDPVAHLPHFTMATHPPAQKVAGRRLSMTSRPKPHIHSIGQKFKPVNDADDVDHNDTPVDYPRPAPPAELAPDEGHHRYQDDQPKHDNKHDAGYVRKAQQTLHNKAEQNRPSKESSGSKVPVSRVNQPNRRLSM